jgi:hypothetical protein
MQGLMLTTPAPTHCLARSAPQGRKRGIIEAARLRDPSAIDGVNTHFVDQDDRRRIHDQH